MATLTKKDLLEAIEDMPMEAPIMIHRGGGFYLPLGYINTKKLWTEEKQVECICIEPKIWEDKPC